MVELAQNDCEPAPLDASDVQATYDSPVLRVGVMDVMRGSDEQFVEPQNGRAAGMVQMHCARPIAA